jgi:small GTP-binding protein
MIGSSGSGKSSLSQRITEKKNVNIKNIGQTIGLDFLTTYYTYNENDIKLDIWDTAGQERFRAVTRSYYKHGDVYLLVFDLNNFNFIDDIDLWINEIHNHSNNNNKHIIIIGNKYDLIDKNDIEKLKNIMEIRNILNEKYPLYPTFFISVKNGENIDILLQNIFDNLKNYTTIKQDNNIDLQKNNSLNNNCC